MDSRESAEMALSLAEGVCWIHLLARWADGEPIDTTEDPREGLAAFAAAAARLAPLEAAGRFVGERPNMLSAENLALIARIRDLIQPGLESEEVRGRRGEIKDTARTLLAAFACGRS